MGNIAAHLVERARTALATDGFAVINELFLPADVEEVVHLMDELLNKLEGLSGSGRPHSRLLRRSAPKDRASMGVDYHEVFYPTSLSPTLLATSVFKLCSELAGALGNKHSMYFNSMIIKYPYGETSILWHRDGDYSPFRLSSRSPGRLSFWIPLQDTSAKNGGIEYISGSHKEKRLLHISESRRVACTIPAGGVSIHTPRTLHCSGRNASDQRRAAWLLTFGKFGSYKLTLMRLFGHVPKPLAS